jgi:hypothetical protein
MRKSLFLITAPHWSKARLRSLRLPQHEMVYCGMSLGDRSAMRSCGLLNSMNL